MFFSNSSVGAKGKLVVKERKTNVKNRELNADGINSAVPTAIGLSAVRSQETFDSAVDEKAKQHNIDPQLVRAVIRAESNWNPNAISPKGALGLMQLMPSTAALLGVSNPFDPFDNIDGGIRYLKHLVDRFNGNLILALAAYNAGPKLVEKKGAVPSIPETIAYVKRVMRFYNGSSWIASNENSQEIQREITKEYKRIKKVVLQDGTLLFTNAYSARTF
ncbi:MAG: lytic transglycosylase domain-containing protein [Nitrospirae bacterium]|nr:lytic transglycosylase domain-containing protein [Nitrospirota bacterium]